MHIKVLVRLMEMRQELRGPGRRRLTYPRSVGNNSATGTAKAQNARSSELEGLWGRLNPTSFYLP